MEEEMRFGSFEKLEDGTLFLKLDKTIYAHEAIVAAAYKFTEYCHVHIETLDSAHYGVFFKPKHLDVDLEFQVGEFCNELIDQQVRHNLHRSNKGIKELIIRKAFFPFEEK